MSTPKDPLQLSTISQAADLLQVNPRTIRRLIDAGKLPSVRVGRAIRIRRSDLEQLLI
tara:strand:- start:4520 stop:4693 length:174 start_codon:yes stop_codon:yes gene_type:complete